MGRISDHDRRMRTRLLIITPLVVMAHLFALITLIHVQILPDAITLGYEGPQRFEPEISIVDNRASQSTTVSRHRSVMIVQDVMIEGEERPSRARGDEPARKPSEKPRDQRIPLEAPGDYPFRTYSSHAPVPYRQDYVILKMIKPEYPLDALANGEEGYVLVEAYINIEGRVGEAYVRSSYGPRSFEGATVEAVKQFLFRPVQERGTSVSFWVSFLVRFRLRH
jgi:TonB family protein